MNLVNFQDILQSFDDLNLFLRVKIVQQLAYLLPKNDEQLNNEYHVQVSCYKINQTIHQLNRIIKVTININIFPVALLITSCGVRFSY